MSQSMNILPDSVVPRLRRDFLISTYLNLAAACICLMYAVWTLLPEAAVVAALIAIMLGVAWKFEGRLSLSHGGANALGLAICAGIGLWFLVHWRRPATSPLHNLPWPSNLLPFLGPALMVLLPAKLFRPKSIADYWALQAIGLVCVGLACALADDMYFGMLLLVYLLSGLWSLGVFFIYRERGMVFPGDDPIALPRWRHILAWSLPILLFGLGVFLYMPRSSATWQLAAANRRQIDVGMPDDQVIDLNRTGTMQLNRDVAFEVFVETSQGRPKLDVRPDQRWRGPTFRYYHNGRWSNNAPGTNFGTFRVSDTLAGVTTATPSSSAMPTLPYFGPEQYALTFTLQGRNLATPFVADFVQVHPSGDIPLVSFRDGIPRRWGMTVDGLFLPTDTFPREKGRYRQVTVPAADPNLGPAVSVEQGYREALTEPSASLPNLHAWSMAFLQRLASSDRRVAEALAALNVDGTIPAERHEDIAKALEAYFASSQEYRYSLDLKRVDKDLDPIEDFLYNSKAGNCNRFATALTVMLRSLRIPSRIVLGFRGADSRGDGHYDVRQCHAHSWVEVFIPRREPPPANLRELGSLGRLTWHWCALDPTPFMESMEASADANSRWWNTGAWNSERLFKDLIVNYSPERRDQAGKMFWDTAVAAWQSLKNVMTARGAVGMRARMGAVLTLLVFGLGSFIAARSVFRRFRRRHREESAPTIAFHRRLLAILARHGWKPAPGQTPAEFADAIAPKLRGMSEGSDLADFVSHATDLFYRVRFGARPLAPDEVAMVEAGLAHLSRMAPGTN